PGDDRTAAVPGAADEGVGARGDRLAVGPAIRSGLRRSAARGHLAAAGKPRGASKRPTGGAFRSPTVAGSHRPSSSADGRLRSRVSLDRGLPAPVDEPLAEPECYRRGVTVDRAGLHLASIKPDALTELLEIRRVRVGCGLLAT